VRLRQRARDHSAGQRLGHGDPPPAGQGELGDLLRARLPGLFVETPEHRAGAHARSPADIRSSTTRSPHWVPDAPCSGIDRTSSSQIRADMSEGARQSPRGDKATHREDRRGPAHPPQLDF
jgi:hypothetical protein